MECGEDEVAAEEGRFLMRNLTKRWRRPETKKMSARMTMVKRAAGLILLLAEDAVGGAWDDGNGNESLLKMLRPGGG